MRATSLRWAILAAALALGASGAHALTIVGGDGTSNGSPNLADADKRAHRFTDQSPSGSNGTTLHFGNSTLQFYGGSSSYGPSPFIRDQFLDSPAARTVPSQSR
jgi:hypothetical protein